MRLLVPLLSIALLLAGCSDRGRQHLPPTPTATYDPGTGRLKELTYDANSNGRVDTWTEMDGARPVRSRVDRNEDGRLDRWEYYDAGGRLEKVGFSRKDDGVVDAWAYAAPGGPVERIEISSHADAARIDRWERYDRAGLQAVDEDTDGNGLVDRWETYEQGALKTVAFDETGDGAADRRLTYEAGVLAIIESAPDASGRLTTRTDVNRPDDPPHRP